MTGCLSTEHPVGLFTDRTRKKLIMNVELLQVRLGNGVMTVLESGMMAVTP